MGYSPWGHKELDMIEQLSTTEVTTIYDKGIFRYLVLILEKAMATHSSTLAWKVPWTEEPGRLQSLGSQRVGHN